MSTALSTLWEIDHEEEIIYFKPLPNHSAKFPSLMCKERNDLHTMYRCLKQR